MDRIVKEREEEQGEEEQEEEERVNRRHFRRIYDNMNDIIHRFDCHWRQECVCGDTAEAAAAAAAAATAAAWTAAAAPTSPTCWAKLSSVSDADSTPPAATLVRLTRPRDPAPPDEDGAGPRCLDARGLVAAWRYSCNSCNA